MSLESSQKSETNPKKLILEKLEAVASEVATRESVYLYDIEMVNGPQGPVLRIYIDKDGGVSIDNCANVSRGMNEFLEQNDPLPGGNYSLEVSSPGIERVLRKAWHFEKAVGQKLWMKLDKPLENFNCQDAKIKSAKTLTENLSAVENESLKFIVTGQEIWIPIGAIINAKVVFSFENKNDKKPQNKKGFKK